MAKAKPAEHIKSIHGKVDKNSNGYYYTNKKGNRQYYRNRDESYNKHHSPLQQWNSAAFAFAAKEWKRLRSLENGDALLQEQFNASDKRDFHGRKVETPRAWKYSFLQAQWKNEHPFDTWYAQQTQELCERTLLLTEANPTKQQIQQQIRKLQQQIDTLNKQLKNITYQSEIE